MKKNIFYLFAHQDDEFGAFIDISHKIKNYNIYIFYLTSGYKKKILKSQLSTRDKESIKVLKKIGVKEKNIIFLGKQLNIKCNELHLNMNKAYHKIIELTYKIKPYELVTHSWEGGHEDHDACNLIARKIGFKLNIIKNSKEFSLYNAYNCKLLYFKVFNPIKKNGKFIRANFYNRWSYILLLFFYRSQFKIWIGLYPFIIFHYLFFGYNYMQTLNQSRIISRPHSGELLYEARSFCNFKEFKNKTKVFLN
ncbi:PIG-L family deacetylase [Candidatus Pelagibacter ubique]|jgi:LmbE family N-acetylglucosaminyl deacetylase|nr:PIG-L family deacetylase [Candidatus Pelagibacter ubique]